MVVLDLGFLILFDPDEDLIEILEFETWVLKERVEIEDWVDEFVFELRLMWIEY
jgi:hypothetical protein